LGVIVPDSFQLVAGHPVLDFVNTLDNRFAARGPTELLRRYADLVRFARQSGLLDVRASAALARKGNCGPAEAALRSARQLREALAALFYSTGGAVKSQGPVQSALTQLRHCYAVADRNRQIVMLSSGSRQDTEVATFGWAWGRAASNCALPVWTLSLMARELLLSPVMQRVHRCHCPTCAWLFLDSSKNQSRRWCDMKVCGNRIKARRFQAKGRHPA
jgi:predicted RNA-binding Zn ribbon-like protein